MHCVSGGPNPNATLSREGNAQRFADGDAKRSPGPRHGHLRASRAPSQTDREACWCRWEQVSGHPNSEKTDATRDPGGQPKRNRPHLRKAVSITCKAEGEEAKNSNPQGVLGNTEDVKSVDANRKGRLADLHQTTTC